MLAPGLMLSTQGRNKFGRVLSPRLTSLESLHSDVAITSWMVKKFTKVLQVSVRKQETNFWVTCETPWEIEHFWDSCTHWLSREGKSHGNKEERSTFLLQWPLSPADKAYHSASCKGEMFTGPSSSITEQSSAG